MKACPRCFQPIPETAVRCRHCRRPLPSAERTKEPLIARERFPVFKFRFAQESRVGWGLAEAALFCVLFLFSAWSIRQQEFSFAWVEWLRQNFFIFTREPLLQVYVYIFTETLILKLGAVLVIFLYLYFHERAVFRPLGLTRAVQNRSVSFLAVFFILSAAVAWWSGLDPLAPDLPTPLFFQESAIVGNILAILSLAVIAPITEEIIFRGFIYPALYPRLGHLAAIFLTAIVFTAAHAPQMNGEYGSLWVIFAVGFLLTWQRAVTGSTLFVIGLHALYNTSLTAAGFIRFSFYGF